MKDASMKGCIINLVMIQCTFHSFHPLAGYKILHYMIYFAYSSINNFNELTIAVRYNPTPLSIRLAGSTV